MASNSLPPRTSASARSLAASDDSANNATSTSCTTRSRTRYPCNSRSSLKMIGASRRAIAERRSSRGLRGLRPRQVSSPRPQVPRSRVRRWSASSSASDLPVGRPRRPMRPRLAGVSRRGGGGRTGEIHRDPRLPQQARRRGVAVGSPTPAAVINSSELFATCPQVHMSVLKSETLPFSLDDPTLFLGERCDSLRFVNA